MSNVVRVEYVDLSTDLEPNEAIVTGDSLDVVARKDQRSEIGVEAGNGDVSIISGKLNDTVAGGEGSDFIDGSDGDDVLRGLAGNDTITAGNGNDAIIGGDGDDSLRGLSGDDTIEGSVGNDIIVAGDGSDVVTGGAGEDKIDGGAGDDILNVASGDVVTGGAGRDRISIELNEDFDPKNPPKVTDFGSGEDRISAVKADGSPVDGDVSLDAETGTLIVNGQAVVEVETDGDDGDFILSPQDIDFGDGNRPISVIDSSETTVYEFMNSDEGISFYTTDENEKAFIEDNLDNYELMEDAGFESIDPLSGSEVDEVHRFLNTQTGTHLYTTNETERDYILDNLEHYNYEDVKFYGYSPETEASVIEDLDLMPVYRFFDAEKGVHMFTHGSSEMNEMSEDGMLDNEGIAFYAMSSEPMASTDALS